MPTLTPSQLSAYAARFDFRSQFVKAAVQILAAGGITAYGPGQGINQMGRYFVSVDFQRGTFTPDVKSPLAQNLGAGAYRSRMYCQFTGILSIMNSVPFQTVEKTGEAYLLEEHVRTLDELQSQQLALFMEPLQPFTAELLPWLDVQQLLPIEPDERPVDEREVNVAFTRWQILASLRPTAWPDVA